MKSLDDVAFAAAWVFLPLLPVTHAAGLVAHCPRAAKLQHILLYPFRGGKNHTIFQSIAWVRACRGAAFGRRWWRCCMFPACLLYSTSSIVTLLQHVFEF